MSKKEIKDEAKIYAESRLDRIDPLSILLKAKKAEEFFKTVQEHVKAEALKEAEKYPERSITLNGAKYEKTSVYTEYDYSNCNDSVLNERMQLFEEAKKALEARKEFLKALKEPLIVTDEDSGETFKVFPPVKKTTDGIKITY